MNQAEAAMQQVHEQLSTDFGLKVCTPPITSSDYKIVRAMLMNPGLKENGGIFVHTQGWGVMAEAMLGHGNRAYEYLKAYLPAAYNTRAKVREIEPYVVCQSTHTRYSPKHGVSRIPWLSGSATWTFYAISHHILGIRPDYHGIHIDPCIPEEWKEFTVTRIFRGKVLNIKVLNPGKKQKGVKRIRLNKKELPVPVISFALLTSQNEIEVELG